ncbi:hypothetical protein EC845_1188 [Comamonas sp. BIGb0124]|nr:hypothetical protein EC845_1188 [Comamonas sp. BIGb0124]
MTEPRHPLTEENPGFMRVPASFPRLRPVVTRVTSCVTPLGPVVTCVTRVTRHLSHMCVRAHVCRRVRTCVYAHEAKPRNTRNTRNHAGLRRNALRITRNHAACERISPACALFHAGSRSLTRFFFQKEVGIGLKLFVLAAINAIPGPAAHFCSSLRPTPCQPCLDLPAARPGPRAPRCRVGLSRLAAAPLPPSPSMHRGGALQPSSAGPPGPMSIAGNSNPAESLVLTSCMR